jgi:hypothetical protein
MKVTGNTQSILNDYLSRKLSLDEFKEAMKHPALITKQKLQIADSYFASLGSRDITEECLGNAVIVVGK